MAPKIKNSALKIIVNDYEKLLTEIQKHITETQGNILKIVTREKIVMAWQIGKIIDEHLLQNNKSGYGESLLKKLEQDIQITETVLYKMRSFYKTYPQLPKDDERLNWSHYRVLSGIKKDEERKYLENLTKQNNWSSDELQQEVAKSKESKISVIRKNAKNSAEKKLAPLTKLNFSRGKLFSYQLIKLDKSLKTYVDCGFGIFREAEETLSTELQKGGQIVDVVKKNKKYSLTKSALPPRKINVYQAKLERVVDGDTLHVILDLGFKIFHKEILRLSGIDAPEISTAAGVKSANALARILKNIPFLIVKTTRTDVYGRYVADVFLGNSELKNDPQKVADEGIYLNQLLLDKKLAVGLKI